MKYLLIITFTAYVQLLSALHESRGGARNTRLRQVAEWTGLEFSILCAGIALIITSLNSNPMPVTECLNGWPFGHSTCDEGRSIRIISHILFEIFPFCAVWTLCQVVVTRIGFNIVRRVALGKKIIR
jgi:hypothetical protein